MVHFHNKAQTIYFGLSFNAFGIWYLCRQAWNETGIWLYWNLVYIFLWKRYETNIISGYFCNLQGLLIWVVFILTLLIVISLDNSWKNIIVNHFKFMYACPYTQFKNQLKRNPAMSNIRNVIKWNNTTFIQFHTLCERNIF